MTAEEIVRGTKKIVSKIVEKVPAGHYFDSHYVINEMVANKNWIAAYVRFVAHYTGDKDSLATGNGQIARLIKQQRVKKISDKSISRTTHGGSPPCTLWKKLP